jgi:hypothetical protein
MNSARLDRIKGIVDETPVIDIHTHLGTNGIWQARDLTDILFYHWLGTELRNAGCPEEICAPQFAGKETKPPSARERIRHAAPYCALIRNTSNYWAFSGLMRDLYGFKNGLDESNWEKAFDAVAERAKDPSWEIEVLRRARIEKLAIEQSFVPRDASAYFRYLNAEPLYGVGLGKPDAFKTIVGTKVGSAVDLNTALSRAIQRLVEEKEIRSLHVWLPAAWRYTAIEEPEIDRLLYYWTSGEHISGYEQNCLASFSADLMAREAAKHALVVQLFHGSTAYGKGFQVGTWHPEYLRTLIYHIGKHPQTRFDLFLATRNASHEATSMARMHTNLMVSGAWWHAFTPSTLIEFFRDRLEMLPVNRWNAFYSDGYCVEWCYGKLLLTKNQLSVALCRMIDEGLLEERDAALIARMVLYDNPMRVYLGKRAG